jgi:UDP-2-acetamido-3-amino-2,3-dideoxy-glucuronate N-acetyltransferase
MEMNKSDKQNIVDVKQGQNVRIGDFVNLYGCEIGDECMIGPFVEIQSGVVIGRRCKIQSHSFICTGVSIADDVFIGHGVVFSNDKHPRSSKDGKLIKSGADWTLLETKVGAGASIGNNATILPGIEIGVGAVIGAGAVVTKSVPAGKTVLGPAMRFK